MKPAKIRESSIRESARKTQRGESCESRGANLAVDSGANPLNPAAESAKDSANLAANPTVNLGANPAQNPVPDSPNLAPQNQANPLNPAPQKAQNAPKITKIAVVLRPSTPALKEVYLRFKAVAEKNGIEVRLEALSAGMIGLLGVEFGALCAWCDIIATLGGDGTLISTLRRSIFANKPTLGVNTGRLGFLTAIVLDELEGFMAKLARGDYEEKCQMILEADFGTANLAANLGDESGESCDSKRDFGRESTQKLHCINEFLIAKQDISGMIKIAAKINGRHFNTYFSDGLIIGTPAGSSAYNISAGGAVVYPYTRNILLTPICAHSLTQRPLVLSDEFELEFELQGCAGNLVIDGQEILRFEEKDRLKVRASAINARLVYAKGRDYFAVLREKFNWGL